MRSLCVCAAVFLAAVSALAGKGVKPSPRNARSLSLVGRPAPEFWLEDLDEHPFDLSATSGHIVLLAFWASWCPPCRAQMPILAALQKDQAANHVDIVLVALDTPAKAQHFLKKAHLDARSLVDESRGVGRTYGVAYIPRAFVIDRDGLVRRVLLGEFKEKDLLRAIDAAR